MKNLKEIIIFLIILIGVIYPIYFWDILPDSIPTHFDIDGQPNGWSSKGIELFILPIVAVFLNVLLSVITYGIEEENRPKAIKLLFGVRFILTVLMTTLQIVTIQWGLGNQMDFTWIIFTFLSVLFAVIGNYSIHIKQNPYFGIRTPWTLADPENWRLTHLFGGKFMFYIGILAFILSLFLRGRFLFMIEFPLILISVMVPVIYSYRLHRQKGKLSN